MEVKIVFDTERDSVEELRKLVSKLQELIAKRERGENNPSFDCQSQDKADEKTGGGCQIVPFEDMSDTMEKIYSGKGEID